MKITDKIKVTLNIHNNSKNLEHQPYFLQKKCICTRTYLLVILCKYQNYFVEQIIVTYLPHKFGQFVAMFPNFSRQIFRNVNIGSSQEFGLGQNLFAISKMSKVDQNWSAASDLRTCQKSKCLKKFFP